MSTNSIPEISTHEYVGQETPGSRRSGHFDEGRLYWPACSCGEWAGRQSWSREQAHRLHAEHVAEAMGRQDHPDAA